MSVGIDRITELIEELNNATKAYDEGKPYMSDQEWDDKYFELVQLEKQMGYTYSNSPTQVINYQVVSSLRKVEHNHPMLSLAKTKDEAEVVEFLGDNEFVAMCKMDGLTCSLTYYNGKLIGAETRGNGVIGEDILHNALVIPSIPKYIDYKGELVVDGEIICCLDTFTNLFSDEYKNSRNFAAGSIRLLDSKECSKRLLTFVAWDVIKGFDEIYSLSNRLTKLGQLDFITVPFFTSPSVGTAHLTSLIESVKMSAELNAYPIDGVVFKFNDVVYGKSLGSTAHHFKNAIAFKFYDETYLTILKDIEWTMGRTGVLTPVAILEPIDIDGSTVSRASLHNLNIMTEIFGPIGPYRLQEVEVFKANMIIPQIASAKPGCGYEEYLIPFPKVCPMCGSELITRVKIGSTFLMCANPDCEGKLINKLDHFCGKKGLDIKGLSKATLDKLIEWGWVNELADIYQLVNYKNEWENKPGFGEKSVANILSAIEASKNPTLQAFISSIGIPLIGRTMAKELIKHISSYEEFRQLIAEQFDFSQYEGFADSKTSAILNFDYEQADKVYEIVKPLQVETSKSDEKTLSGYNIVITGRLEKFKNRAQLQAEIELRGGKVVGSVSSNTDFLINNDKTSGSAKNVAAQKLGIPIITEVEFTERFL